MSAFWSFKAPEEAKQMKEGEKCDLTPQKNGGLVKELKKSGHGEDYPNSGDTVLIEYTAYIISIGEEHIFDSSKKPDAQGKIQPFKFKMDQGEVVRGFELAVSTMKKGERAIIYLQPEYGFGRTGALPKVPPNTNVIFDAEIVDFFGEDLSEAGDRTVIKHVIQKGKGHTSVNDGGLVEAHITGKHEGNVFEDRDVTFIMGEGAVHGLLPQVEECFKDIKEDEIAKLTLAPKYYCEGKGCPEKNIPPNAEITYIVHLKKFERAKDIWELNNEQKLDQCVIFKQKGTDFFKKSEFSLALKYYSRVLSYLEHDRCFEKEEESRRLEILLAAHLNCAQCELNLKKYFDAKQQCDKAIALDPNSVKGYFRRGQALFNKKDYTEAKADFQKVVELEPGNKIAKKRIIDCEKQIKTMASEEHDLYKRMMSGIGQGGKNSQQEVIYNRGDVFDSLGDWNNSMAHGMMTLEQECEAFGETIPVRGNNNSGH